MTTGKFLLVSLLTIVAYRLGTYIVIYFWGNTSWWHGVYADQWNHYQLGIILVSAGFLLLKKTRISSFSWSLVGIGTGMLIDEVADIIKLLHLYPLPPNFRDSLGDLFLIGISYLVFALLIKFMPKRF